MKASSKQLKAVLASGIKNFGSSSIVLKWIEFPIFDDFFPNLAKFWDLDVFSRFDFLT